MKKYFINKEEVNKAFEKFDNTKSDFDNALDTAKHSVELNKNKSKTKRRFNMSKSKTTTSRKGYREFMISNLSNGPVTKKDLIKKFLKKYPDNTDTLTADEKAEREVARQIYFLNQEGILKNQKVKGSTRNEKSFSINKPDAARALKPKPRAASKPAAGKSTAKKTAAKPAAKKQTKPAAKKSNKPVTKKSGSSKKFF